MAKSLSGKWVVGLAVAAIAAMFAVVMVAFTTVGRRRFEVGSKMTEAHVNVALLARGISSCIEQRGALPLTTPFIPVNVSDLTHGYQARDLDYDHDAFRCARFEAPSPQYFQYRWESVGALRGIAEAGGDTNGDGIIDARFYSFVDCTRSSSPSMPSTLTCVIGPVATGDWANVRWPDSPSVVR